MNTTAQAHGEPSDMIDEFHRTGPDSLMGKLLRRFWQPVAVSQSLAKGKARALRILSEDLTLFRGESGRAHLVAGRCAHRGTLLSSGWVGGDSIRCMYHGWVFDAQGVCTQIPAEKRPRPEPLRIASYPVHEYAGLVFAYMGEGEAPEFQLPRKDFLEQPDVRVFPAEQVWDTNWFQLSENSMDATHVSFVHGWGKGNRFAQEIGAAIPELSYEETPSGLRQTAVRSASNVRVSDWTFPNNNHIITPGPRPDDPWVHHMAWVVPVDDTHCLRIQVSAFKDTDEDARHRILKDNDCDYNPVDHYDELFSSAGVESLTQMELILAQDYVSIRGQGAIADRRAENLSQSDAGIVLLRRIFVREMETVRQGKPGKAWAKLKEAAELPTPVRAAA